jgi:N-carbamoyl-L-amino-acid hydrolase
MAFNPEGIARETPYLAGAERHAPGMHMRLPSATGHDAAVLSYRMPAGMMFIPSLGGVSHHW